jgi:hypothetical protein
MFRSRLVLFAILITGLLCVSSSAQQKSAKSTFSDLAIEIAGDHPRPFPVSLSKGGYTQIGPPPKRPDWKQAQDTAPLTSIRIRPTLEGDGVRITIGAIFDDSEPVDVPGPKYGEKERTIASYFAQPGDTVSVSELEPFGFEPLVLKVIKYKPPATAEPAPAILPEVVNDLKSVVFIDLQDEQPSSQSYRLMMQNPTAKSIVALTIQSAPGATESVEGTRQKPLATPGSAFHTIVNCSGGGVEEPLRSKLVIQTVLFDDDSYEGNVVTAAEMAARARGRQIQLSRVLELLPETGRSETIKSIQELKAGVEKLRIDVDNSIVEEMLSKFPALPKNYGKTWLATRLMDGLKGGRGQALSLVNSVERERARDPKNPDLNQSLANLRERVASLVRNQ